MHGLGLPGSAGLAMETHIRTFAARLPPSESGHWFMCYVLAFLRASAIAVEGEAWDKLAVRVHGREWQVHIQHPTFPEPPTISRRTRNTGRLRSGKL